ncbi:MAG: serine/threonine-protein kinase [Betaproteobacteria bacterium]
MQVDRRLWRDLSPMLDRALELESGPRAEYLASIRLTDPAVAEALEGLLAEHEQVRVSDFLETPAIGTDSMPAMPAERTIGAYTLERPLGMGGMGTVWLARRSDGRFDGQVALKLVNLAVFDAAARERFAREGTLLARLAHPNIAHLFDAGVTASGQPYLVLEYVDGMRIDAYADSHRLGVRARLELFRQVAGAVAHAHANLVVHRDLKPSNILVDAAGCVKLLDFGIAKLLEDKQREITITIPTTQALTPRYAAPEQVSGGAITTAVDVYALGVLLYELLAGAHPTAPPGADPPAQVRALGDREPTRMSDAIRLLAADAVNGSRVAAERATSLERLRRACRGDLDTIVGKALRKSPAERYSTVTAFDEDVRRYLENEPVTARPESVLYRTRKFVGRHRVGLAAAATAVVALIAGTTIAVLQARQSARERDRALAALRRAEATDDFSSFLLSQARPAGKPISNAELLARGEVLIAKRFANDPALRVNLLLNLADRYQENQQFDARTRVLTQAYEESRNLADAGLRSYATCEWASQVAERGDYSQAFPLLDGVMPVLASTPDYADFEARCRVIESIAANQAADSVRAIAAAERAVALAEQRVGAPGTQLDALAALSTAYSSGYRYDAADNAFRRTLGLLESQGLGDTLDAAQILNNWSTMLQNAGQMLAAVHVSERAIRIARAADTEHGPSMSMLATYGNALSAVGDHSAAQSVLDEAMAKARLAGSRARLILTFRYAISAAYEAGRADRGARLLTGASAALNADPNASAFLKGVVDVGAAQIALASGDPARAASIARRALATLETATPNHAGALAARIVLARTLNATGRFGEALAVADSSVAESSAHLGDQKHSYYLGVALLEVASAKAGLGDLPAARTALSGALGHLEPTVGPNSAAVKRAEAVRRRIEARPAPGQEVGRR